MARRKRRNWSDEEKISICLQTKAPGVSVSQVARRYAMSGNQIFNGLKDARFSPSPPDSEDDDGVFLPVTLSSDSSPEPAAAYNPVSTPPSRLEIALSGGHRLSVEGDFGGDALARLLQGLIS
jgi:transposase